MLTNVLLWILFGVLTGWIVALITRTARKMHIMAYMIIGMTGSLTSSFTLQMIYADSFDEVTLSSVLVAIFGALALLMLVKIIFRQ